MPIILPPRAKTQFRLLCSEDRKRNSDSDDGLTCLFEEYTSPPDEALMDVHFELSERDGLLERRERGQEWAPYTGKAVLCMGCYDHSKGQNFVVFDPRTKKEVGA